jgi:hypothetical protein
MRRLVAIVFAGVLLTGAASAYAWEGGGFGFQSVKSVSATFTATTANGVQTSTCTGTDGGTYVASRGEYTGTATSTEPTLSGPATIDAQSLINTTTGVGFVTGSLSIAATGGTTTTGFSAVYSKGTIVGFTIGGGGGGQGGGHFEHSIRAHYDGGNGNQGSSDDDQGGGGGNSGVQLLANLNAGFDAMGGFTNGQLGGPTSSGGGAVELSQGGCAQAPAQTTEQVDVRGIVSAVSPTSITAGGVTCVVPSSLATAVGQFKNGDAVFMECTFSAGTTTLTQIAAANQGGGGGDWHGSVVFHGPVGNKMMAKAGFPHRFFYSNRHH